MDFEIFENHAVRFGNAGINPHLSNEGAVLK